MGIDRLVEIFESEENQLVRKHLAHAIQAKTRSLLQDVTPKTIIQSEKETYQNCGKIEAIKKVRMRTGLGLREAKQLIEYCCESGPTPNYFS